MPISLMPISQKLPADNKRGFSPVLIIIIVAVLLLGGVAVSAGVIKVDPNKSAKPNEKAGLSTDLPKSSLETYKSDQYGYSIQHPKGWVVKDQSGADKREILVMHPQNFANVLIAARIDKSLKDKAGMEKAINARKEFLESESGLKVGNFKSQVEDKKGGWMMVGEKTIDGKQWVVTERGLIDVYGKVLLEQTGYSLDQGKDYKDVVTQVLDSFKVE